MRHSPRVPGFKPKQWTWFTPKNKTIRCYLRPTPRLHFLHPLGKLQNVWLIVRQLPIKAGWWDTFYSIAYYILLGRDHWFWALKKRENVPSAWSQTFTKKRTRSFWGKIFGWLRNDYSSSAGTYNTDVVRTLFKFLFVCDCIPRDLWSILFVAVATLGKWPYISVFFLILSDS